MKRRDFLKYSLLAPFAFSAVGSFLSCGVGSGGSQDSKIPLNLPTEGGGLLGILRLDSQTLNTTAVNSPLFEIEASPDSLEILPGKITNNLLTYKVGNYTNPIIVLRKGQQFSCNFVNKTGEKSIIHWHGFRAPWKSDGHPAYEAEDGESYQYPLFTIIDRSGTYFYHPHPHGRTGYQVYHGLASMIIIEDDDEDNLRNTLDLQLGVTDIPLIIQDKTFDANGNLVYNPMGMNGNMGFWGDTILVNFTVNPYLDVERRIYRFRILNGSNARPYRLVLLGESGKIPFYVIGVEGGLLAEPVQTDEILVAPGERIDILVDFRLANVGDVLKLYSLQHNLVGMGGMGGGGGMNGGMMNLINREFEVLEFRVVRDSTYDRQIPDQLSEVTPINTAGVPPQDIPLGMSMEGFNIDGNIWNGDNALADYGYKYNNGDVVVFRITNMTGMYHPMHFHGFQFQILRRSSGPLRPTDLGWKDTVIVAPGETVEVAMDMTLGFTTTETQYYLFHCHILEHHDAGMMVNFTVAPGSNQNV